MGTASANIPGSVGERRKMRQELESVVDQKVTETADLGENDGAGGLPAGFCSLTCPVYKWEQLHTTILKSSRPEERIPFVVEDESDVSEKKKSFYQLAVANPGAVSWYCGLKLEMSVWLTKALLTRQLQSETSTPGYALAREWGKRISENMGVEVSVDDVDLGDSWGLVDDIYATFEWSAGGMVHVHIAFWIAGAPRIDRVAEAPDGNPDNEEAIFHDLDMDGEVVLEQGEAASRLASFFDRAYTEWNLQKAPVGKHIESTEAGQPGRRLQMGKTVERSCPAPDMLSERSLRMLLAVYPDNGGSLVEMPQGPGSGPTAWQELDDIFAGDGEMCRYWQETQEDLKLLPCSKLARARRVFVAILAEWMQMHDYHTPFANGPPAKGQSCAKVENEHSHSEKVACGKLFPRKPILPGSEEVCEDPRRRELFRLWLARNCNFMNNFVPIICFATLANMDFQATITKFGVLEYMTKYMTKAGQGSLLGVMEHSFSLCMEKAREQQKGVGAAILKWFNLQSTTDVKSQLETMHLAFRLPRFLCTRSFRSLAVRSEAKKMISVTTLCAADSLAAPLTATSPVDAYLKRCSVPLPKDGLLDELHPITGQPLRQLVSGHDAVAEDWPAFLERLSWWEFTRTFKTAGASLRLKPVPDIIVVRPFPRLAKATVGTDWCLHARNALLAYCNHGPDSRTFKTCQDLDAMSDEAVDELLIRFVTMSEDDRRKDGMCTCPPFLRRAFELGKARQAREEKRKRSIKSVLSALQQKVQYVFDGESVPH